MIFCSIKKGDFNKKYSKNKFKSPYFILFYNKNSLKYSRYGIVVTKKSGNAIKRNKIKRWIKNSLYDNIKEFRSYGYDFIVIANKYYDFSRANYNSINKSINEAFINFIK